MSPLAAIFLRDLRLAVRVGGGGGIGVLFFLIVVVLMPFAIGPDLALLIRGDYVVSDATLNRFFSFHVIAVPLVDMVLAVVRRTRAGQKPWDADARHLHHQLLRFPQEN